MFMSNSVEIQVGAFLAGMPLSKVVENLLTLDAETPIGASVDKIMQIVSIKEMLDYYIGTDILPDGSVKLYFSEYTPQPKIDDLSQELATLSVKAQSMQSDQAGAKWMILITQPRSQKQPETSGDVRQTINVGGQVPVSQ